MEFRRRESSTSEPRPGARSSVGVTIMVVAAWGVMVVAGAAVDAGGALRSTERDSLDRRRGALVRILIAACWETGARYAAAAVVPADCEYRRFMSWNQSVLAVSLCVSASWCCCKSVRSISTSCGEGLTVEKRVAAQALASATLTSSASPPKDPHARRTSCVDEIFLDDSGSAEFWPEYNPEVDDADDGRPLGTGEADEDGCRGCGERAVRTAARSRSSSDRLIGAAVAGSSRSGTMEWLLSVTTGADTS
jgi:hypothetical protein